MESGERPQFLVVTLKRGMVVLAVRTITPIVALHVFGDKL